jgi:hypothetical protein
MERHDDAFVPRSPLFDQGMGDALRDLALLIDRARPWTMVIEPSA